MNSHQNAGTTPYSRGVLVERVLKQGRPHQAVAGELGISVRTVGKWLARQRAEGLAGLENRPSTAHFRPHRTPVDREALIGELRRNHRMTGRQIAQQLDMPASTVAAVLRRLGLNRLKLLEPKPIRRYEKAKPGELIDVDIKKPGRIQGVGHRITGNRRDTHRGAGWEYAHVCVDDHSRLAYVEVLPNERAESATAFLKRACLWFRQHGVRVRRVTTDNGSCYISKAFATRCRHLGLGHKAHPALHPQNQRQGRTLHPNPDPRMGLWPGPRPLAATHRASAPMARLLQPRPASRRHRLQTALVKNRSG